MILDPGQWKSPLSLKNNGSFVPLYQWCKALGRSELAKGVVVVVAGVVTWMVVLAGVVVIMVVGVVFVVAGVVTWMVVLAGVVVIMVVGVVILVVVVAGVVVVVCLACFTVRN